MLLAAEGHLDAVGQLVAQAHRVVGQLLGLHGHAGGHSHTLPVALVGGAQGAGGGDSLGGGLVQQLLHGGDQVGRVLDDRAGAEAALAHGGEQVAAIIELDVGADQGEGAHRVGLGGLGAHAPLAHLVARAQQHNPEGRAPLQAAPDHQLVALLEDVQV